MEPIVDIFGDIVAAVSGKLTANFKLIDPKITGIHYEHGHPVEIIETLRQKDESNKYKFSKYPLVALFQDFPEDHNRSDGLIDASLHVVICRSTDNKYKAKDRYAYNFIPYLYPIYEELLRQIDRHPFSVGYEQRHTKIDRLYWGKEGLYGNEGNMFDDYLDAIEINNLRLLLNIHKNC